MCKVKNLPGTSYCEFPSKFDSWLHCWYDWAKDNGVDVRITGGNMRCYRDGCKEITEVIGGHVRLVNDDGACYIVPLCKTHNSPSETDSFFVDEEGLMRIGQRCKFRTTGYNASCLLGE
jgi:hypothetical protein